ncbi:M4 family metallopeptidase [Longispora sp. K20-0274]|uniref:M4 family metallopeptidase n=1 Tax=Longispora sp. K20-0274 TaxID=3088255 RepID=UPI00399AD216
MKRFALLLVAALTSTAMIQAPARAADGIHALGTGTGFYYGAVTLGVSPTGLTGFQLRDPARNNSATLTKTGAPITSPTSHFGDGGNNPISAAADAHYALAATYDYFRTNHGFAGMLQYRIPDPYNGRPVVSLDLIGHEASHTVIDSLVGLNYTGESAGLREAWADVFGTLVEFSVNHPADVPDYTIGEKLGVPLRRLDDPALDGVSDSCWTTATKTKSPWAASGVGRHAFYLMAVGAGPTCGGMPAPVGIGNAKSARIWYRSLLYMTPSTVYVSSSGANTARRAMVNAALDLYGHGPECVAVKAAWTAVAVPATTGEAAC